MSLISETQIENQQKIEYICEENKTIEELEHKPNGIPLEDVEESLWILNDELIYQLDLNENNTKGNLNNILDV